MKRSLTVFICVLVLAGCAARNAPDRARVSGALAERTGHGLAPSPPAEAAIPAGVSLDDGITEDEAVALALWNNAQLQLDLAALGFARADLIEAGMLRNPILSLLFPLGPKQLEATATWPVETLWQRPRRVAAARVAAEVVAENLVQHGLNVVRDVRVAHSELLTSQRRVLVAEEAAAVRRQIADITEARLRAGDISEMETNPARAESRAAQESAARAGRDLLDKQNQLRFLLGLPADNAVIKPVASAEPIVPPAVAELQKQALAARPDLRAAELAMEAAAKRAGWERSKIFNLIGILDINTGPFEAGPGIETELPLLNRNDAGRARAAAEIERAAREYVVVKQRIVLEVQQAHAALAQTRASLETWQRDVLPPLQAAQREAERAYQAGEVSYLFVLEATRSLFDARQRELDLAAEVRRAAAELDRSVGRRILAPTK